MLDITTVERDVLKFFAASGGENLLHVGLRLWQQLVLLRDFYK